MVFDSFKCTRDSSKRLGHRCVPWLNKAFHFTRIFMYKRLPCIIDFPLHVISLYSYEGFPLYKLFSCMRDFLLRWISIYQGVLGVALSKAFHFTRVSTCKGFSLYKGFPCIRDFPLHVISHCIYEGFPLYNKCPFIMDFLV